MEEQTTAPVLNENELTQPSFTKPEKQYKTYIVPYVIAGVAFIAIIIGGIYLFSYMSAQSQLTPVVTYNSPSQTPSVVTPTVSTIVLQKPTSKAQAESQLTVLQNMVNSFTSSEASAYQDTTSSINNTNQDSTDQSSTQSL